MTRRQLDVDLLRGALRKVKYAKGRSSFPFISGDTYASLCDYQFNPKLSLTAQRKNSESIKFFLPGNLKDQFMVKLNSDNSDYSYDTLVIHNSDHIPNHSEMITFSKRFKSVYSVNWLGELTIARPIPIGLENWSHLRNGVPSDYLKLIDQGLLPGSERSIRILSSFSIQTNIEERTKAFDFSRSNSEVFQTPSFISPKEYRELVADSAFVISPPGNGADCHRTWEAIYLGAVPIVLKRYWPFNHLKLPVLVVEDWHEIPKMIENSSGWRQLSIEELRCDFLSFP
jgi:hypothetical protein